VWRAARSLITADDVLNSWMIAYPFRQFSVAW
jgi:hypothetical protein